MRKIEVAVEEWTPEIAREAIKNPTKGQRAINQTNVRAFRAMIENGRWFPETSAPICFATTGELQNGNHRGHAIAGLPDGTVVPVLVARNVLDDAVPHMDTGAGRTTAHHLNYAFPDSAHNRAIAAIAPLVMKTSGPPNLPDVAPKRLDPADVIAHVAANYDRYERAALIASSVARAENNEGGRVTTARTLGWLLWFTLDHADAEEFWRQHGARRIGGSEDPRYQMVRHYSRPENAFTRGASSRTQTLERMAALAACWDAHIKGAGWKPWNGTPGTFCFPSIDHTRKEAA